MHYIGVDEYKYAVKVIALKAVKLIGTVGFTEADFQDLRQEMACHLVERVHQYHPERAKFTTFVNSVLDHKIANIIESRTTKRRDYRVCNCSLNDRFEDEEGNSIERIETIDQEDHLRRTGKLSRPAAELLDLTVEVDRAIEKLPPELRELCRRLVTNNVTEISIETGMPRGTIYDEMKKIRAIFEAAGLGDYN